MSINKNSVIGVIVILVILVGGIAFFANMQNSSTSAPVPTPLDQQMTPESTAPTDTTQATSSGDAMAGPKEIIVSGSNFKFEPSTISVNKGDKVKITFQNAQGTHDFVLPDFNVQTKQIGGSQSDSVSFIADKTGSFEYFCSVGNHRAMGMKGTLIVK